MNRVIKFRAWHKTAENANPSMTYWKLEDGYGNSTNFFEAAFNKRFGVGGLMEFTGLLDKNGKEIYEGDIVKYFVEHNGPAGDETAVETFIEEVSFVDGQFCVDGYAPVNCFPCEVIGDVYRNPELLNK